MKSLTAQPEIPRNKLTIPTLCVSNLTRNRRCSITPATVPKKMSTQLDPSTANADMPRSRRVVQPDPSDYKAFTTSSEPSSPPPLASPPLPPRSPLRPKAYAMSIDTRSSVLSSASGSTAYASDTTSLAGLSHAPSFGSLSTLVNARTSFRAKTPDKPLPILPPSPLPEETFDPDASFGSEPSSLGLSVSSSCPTSKRNHALLELLTSERSYAQDLCLIRDIHIPLAYGASLLFFEM